MIDARSDAVTLPTQAMLDAMLRVGHTNDFLDEDTEVRMLESEAAVLTGKDEGLFVVSGTMANLVALAAYSQPGHFVFADEGSHIIQWECEGIERFTGMQCLPVPALGEEMMS
jgi:threonine aldolase